MTFERIDEEPEAPVAGGEETPPGGDVLPARDEPTGS